MTTVRGGAVRRHVQAFADACSAATGADNFGTYNGHDPSIDRALDIFVPVSSRTLGDAICDFAQQNEERYGVHYVIYRQHIWNPDITNNWRPMADRGNPTQNHFDHVHVSFDASAPMADDKPAPAPIPEPQEENEGMKLIAVDSDRGIFLAGETVEEDGKVLARHVGSPEQVAALVESGAVSNYDKRPVLAAGVFDAYYRVVG